MIKSLVKGIKGIEVIAKTGAGFLKGRKQFERELKMIRRCIGEISELNEEDKMGFEEVSRRFDGSRDGLKRIRKGKNVNSENPMIFVPIFRNFNIM